MPHKEFLKQPSDELLEEIWCQKEKGDESVSGLLRVSTEKDAKAILDRLVRDGMVTIRDDHVEFTSAGHERAEAIVRSRRLTERLLVDVLDVPWEEAEKTACLMEHVLSPSVVDAVCAFLGHPPTSPRGEPIPLGPTCREHTEEVTPVVTPLDKLPPGVTARIVFITPGFQKRLDRLASFGVMPGTVLELKQKHPSFVLEIGGTTLAVEKDIAHEIYVRRES